MSFNIIQASFNQHCSLDRFQENRSMRKYMLNSTNPFRHDTVLCSLPLTYANISGDVSSCTCYSTIIQHFFLGMRGQFQHVPLIQTGSMITALNLLAYVWWRLCSCLRKSKKLLAKWGQLVNQPTPPYWSTILLLLVQQILQYYSTKQIIVNRRRTNNNI